MQRLLSLSFWIFVRFFLLFFDFKLILGKGQILVAMSNVKQRDIIKQPNTVRERGPH